MVPYSWPQQPMTYYTTNYAAENFRLYFDALGLVYRINTSTGETWRAWEGKWTLIEEPEIPNEQEESR